MNDAKTTRSTLNTLLGSLEEKVFFEDYWQKKQKLIKHPPEKWNKLASWDIFNNLLNNNKFTDKDILLVKNGSESPKNLTVPSYTRALTATYQENLVDYQRVLDYIYKKKIFSAIY